MQVPQRGPGQRDQPERGLGRTPLSGFFCSHLPRPRAAQVQADMPRPCLIGSRVSGGRPLMPARQVANNRRGRGAVAHRVAHTPARSRWRSNPLAGGCWWRRRRRREPVQPPSASHHTSPQPSGRRAAQRAWMAPSQNVSDCRRRQTPYRPVGRRRHVWRRPP